MLHYTNPSNGNGKPRDSGFWIIAWAALGLVGFIFLIAVMRAIVVKALWGWYVSPHFSVPDLDIPTAFGIALLVSYLSQVHPTDKTESSDSFGLRLWNAILLPIGVYFVGWIGTLFM